ncbi:sodium/proton antiporter, CPA1 family [bacterium A37T11]|nr:sodium/proton antiporter, CPA1 family [bacterium A37T11]
MIHNNLILILILLFGITILVMVGQKLKIAYPIFLVLAGLIIGFIPGMPRITVRHDLIFLIFLPPLLYEAAWLTSWKDFWEYKGAILFMAVGLVFITSIAIAYTSVYLIPGFTLALGFVLGGIISPPDAVAASTILKGVKIPKAISAILEGESLVNDASSLIVFKFALLAVTTGTFVFHEAAVGFVSVSIFGILVGLGVGCIFYAIHRWLPTTDDIDTVLTFLAPYFMYITAEHFEVSGVMAVVAGGLFLSNQSHIIFSSNTRVKAYSVWRSITFMMNGVVFILIGLALPDIVEGLKQDGTPLTEAIGYGALLSLLAVVVRFVWLFSTANITSLVNKQSRIRYQGVTWHSNLVTVFAGMRGVVSLAAALSIPALIDERPFPMRNLILFITFVVIFFTLVVQGLLLPLIVRALNIPENKFKLPEDEQISRIKLHLIELSLRKLKSDYPAQCLHNDLMSNYKAELERSLIDKKKRMEVLHTGGVEEDSLLNYNEIMLELIKLQRRELHTLRRSKDYDDEVIRREEWRLDLEELSIEGSN